MVAGQPERVQSPARNRFEIRRSAERAARFEAGPGGKRRADFLHHVRLFQFRFARSGEELAEFAHGQRDHVRARHFHQAARSADDQLDVAASALC